MKFAVHRLGVPEASPRRHGVPRRNVPGRVHVGVAGETAGHRYHDAAVDTNDFTSTRCWDRRRDCREGDVPAPCTIHSHAVRLHAWRHWAGPAEPHPSGLRHPYLADMARQPPHIPLPPASPHDPKPLIPACLSPRRPPGRIVRVEERGHCLSEVPQRLLLDRLGARSQPGVLRPYGGQLATLFHETGGALPARVPVLVLLDGQVPHVPGLAAVVPQHRVLGGCGEQSVSGHTNTLASTPDILGEVRRRFLPVLKTEISAPPS